MFAAWRYEENGLDAWVTQKVGVKMARFVRPVIVTLLEIAAAPVELAQRLFYRPNLRPDKREVEDLRVKSVHRLKQSYIDSCTQQFYGDKYAGVKLDARRTYDNLTACSSGTFKTISPREAEPEASVPIVPEVHAAPNSMSISRMTDSQIISSQRRSLVVRPFKGDLAVNQFGATASGTFVPMPSFYEWHQDTTSKKLNGNSPAQSGTYPTVEAGFNPHGLNQFIESKEERSHGSDPVR